MRQSSDVLYLAATLAVLVSPAALGEQRSDPWEYCSIINLIATPDAYHGKRVRTEGVAVIQFEGNGLYLTLEHARVGAMANAVRLAIPGSHAEHQQSVGHLHHRHVLVEGVFQKPDRPAGVGFRGHLTDISLLYAPGEVPVLDNARPLDAPPSEQPPN